MAVNKLDPKIIFASEAPAQDVPAVFTNKTVGWGESRKNGGRPTIKQSNALQQETDLKILWLNENAVTPYDATIDYPVNTVTLKDGTFKIFNGSVWNTFLTKSSVGLGNVDNTSDLNKPISTATQDALNGKASVTSVTSLQTTVNTKADKTYVDTNLALKADLSVVKRGIGNIYDPTLTYNENERVILLNGDTVQSTISNNANNPNTNMTGWVVISAKNPISTVESIANLSTIQNPKNGQVVFAKSYYSGLNAGGRKVSYDSSKSGINDGVFIFNGWVSEPILNLSPDHAGAKPNDVTFDNTEALNKVFATGQNIYGRKSDVYHVTGNLNSKGQKLIGDWLIKTSRKDDHAKDIANYDLITSNDGFDNSGLIRLIYVSGAYELCEMLAIKQLGFNSIHHYGAFHHLPSDFDGTLEKLANNCKTAGLKISFGTEQHPLAVSDLQAFVTQCDSYDATFAYSVYDEPAARGFTVAQQDARINLLRGYTRKLLTMVDYMSTLTPFIQLFSTKYDIAFVDSYAVQGNTLDQNLAKMRFDFGGVKAMTGISRLIPVVSSYLDNGSFITDDIEAVIASSSVFGTVGEGEFGAFIWDGYSDPNILVNTRNNGRLRNLVKGIASQIVRKKVITDCYIFGRGESQTDWGLQSIIDNLTVADKNTIDSRYDVNAFPVVLHSASTESDRGSTIPNIFRSGIGFKGWNGYLCTKIKARENTNIHLEYADIVGSGQTTVRINTTPDDGYKKSLRYETVSNGGAVIKTNIKMTAPNDSLLFEIENATNANSYYRQFLRGLIVCTSW